MHFSTLKSSFLAVALCASVLEAHPAVLPYPHETRSLLTLYNRNAKVSSDGSLVPIHSRDAKVGSDGSLVPIASRSPIVGEDGTLVPVHPRNDDASSPPESASSRNLKPITIHPRSLSSLLPRLPTTNAWRNSNLIPLRLPEALFSRHSPKDFRHRERHVAKRPASFLPLAILGIQSPSDSNRLYHYDSDTANLSNNGQHQEPMAPTSGTIKMGSSMNHYIPLNFAFSEESCAAVASEFACLIHDLTSQLLEAHPSGVLFEKTERFATPSAQIIETVRMEMNGRDYRAMLALNLKATVPDLNAMPRNEYRALIGLLGKTATSLREDVDSRATGFGLLEVETEIEGVAVDAKWVFYEVHRGEARKCL